MTLDIGKLVLSTSQLGATYVRRRRKARMQKPDDNTPAMCREYYWKQRYGVHHEHYQCSTCGALEQRVGEPCEYCKTYVRARER